MTRVRVRIREGVAAGLCGTCEYARIMRTKYTDREQVFCEENHPMMIVPEPLAECSDYLAKGTLSQHQMEKIAWTIEIKGGKIGFRPPPKEDPNG